MPTATRTQSGSGIERLIQGMQENGKAAVDSMKRVVDTVNDAFPDITPDKPRRKIIDAAFAATQQVLDTSNQLTLSIVRAVDPSSPRPQKTAAAS